jgi:hypothetical protein
MVFPLAETVLARIDRRYRRRLDPSESQRRSGGGIKRARVGLKE